jgi:hypothetical protein
MVTSTRSGGSQDPRSAAVFEEDVVARNSLLRRLAVVARPLFRANHAVMMRHGREQLGVYLAGYRTGVVDRLT